MSVTVVVGPCGVRSSGRSSDEVSDWAATALATIDDEFTLVDERPVAVATLWRELFASLLADESALLVCPSWWSDRRVDTVVAAARATVADVAVRRRPALLAASQAHRPDVVVEIADSFVALTRAPDHGPVATVSREGTPAAVADDVMRQVASMCGRWAVIDRADGVGGAADLAAMLTDRMRAHGITVGVVDDDGLMQAADLAEQAENSSDSEHFDVGSEPQRAMRVFGLAAGVAAASVLVVAAVTGWSRIPSTPETTLLIEGRVVVEVPSSWDARRVTNGPGSVRLQVTSPTDPHAAVHVTQSAVPRTERLQDTAGTLRRAMADEPPGVFVDFDPEDRRGDRPAVTYREIRAGHDIRWTVVLDGGLRISVGCQSARGAEAAVAPVCERAVASVRDLG